MHLCAAELHDAAAERSALDAAGPAIVSVTNDSVSGIACAYVHRMTLYVNKCNANSLHLR